MPQPIGVIVQEVEAAVGAEIVPSPLGIPGLLIESERGLTTKAVQITSLTEAITRFGNPVSGLFGFFALRAMFRNALPFGVRAWVTRVVGAGSAASATTLTSGDTLFTTDGSFGGTPADYTVTIEAGTLASTKKVTFKDDAGAPTRTEVYDNIADTSELCDAINRGQAVGSVTLDVNGGGAGAPAASLLFAVTYAGGVLPDNLVETAAGADLTVPAVVAAAVNSIFNAGQLGVADVGTWGDSLRITSEPSPGAEYQRTLTISRIENGDLVEKETFLNLDADDFASVLNSVDVGSNYVMVDTIGALPNGDITNQQFTGGADGAGPALSEYQTALSTLDATDVTIVTITDLITPDAASALEAYAAANFQVAVAAVAQGTSIATVKSTWFNALAKQKSFLALYRSFVEVDDTLGGRVFVPPVGHVIGAGYIRRMFNHSRLPHTAPAGLDTPLVDALDLEFRSLSDTDLEDLVHNGGTNPLMFVPGRGLIIRTSRTMSTLNPNYSVHIRRSLNYLRRTFKENLGFVEQLPNDSITRARVRQILNAFLLDLFGKGMFQRTKGFANNVEVKCDTENNTDNDINNRRLNVDIKLRFVEVAELIVVKLESTRSGILTSESAA